VPAEWLTPPGDARALAETIATLAVDPNAGARARERAGALLDPERLAATLAAIYS
jgi:hypothetical protein